MGENAPSSASHHSASREGRLPMLTGLDRVLADCPSSLRNRRVGLLTNAGGVDRDLRSGPEVLQAAGAFHLERLFAHEHGLYGDIDAGDPVDDTTDRRTGLPVVSLYGPKAPTAELVGGLDAVLVDLQDRGARYYTVLGTTLRLLRMCHAAGIPLYVLDRPNPIGATFEGQRAVDPAYRSLVGAAAVPMRHGLTLGELTRLAAREHAWEDALRIVTVDGWRRSQTWQDLGRPWIPGSPNSNSLDMARLYPGTCLVEGTNLSEGRGTAFPFQQVGAPWVDGWGLADRLRPVLPEGLWCRAVAFRPSASKHRGLRCEGVMLHLDPGREVPVLLAALHLLSLLLFYPETRFLEPSEEDPPGRPFFDLLAGNDRLRHDLKARRPPEEILREWEEALQDWPDVQAAVSLYPD